MNTLDSVFDNQQDGARIGASMERCSREEFTSLTQKNQN
jgi:hypothetical protein